MFGEGYDVLPVEIFVITAVRSLVSAAIIIIKGPVAIVASGVNWRKE